jgi:Icc protein
VTATYNLYNNETRVVAFDANKGHPEDAKYQAPDARIPPQIHY